VAKISLTICDLCKKEIKDSDNSYSIILQADSEEKNGEICCICYRSLLGRLNRIAELPWAAPPAPDNSKQILDCIAVTDGAHTTSLGKSAFIKSSEHSGDNEGMLKIPSIAHTVPQLPSPKCSHDKKRMDDNERFVCLICGDKLDV